MLGLYVTVPIACWRKGHAREYLETWPVPPPSTCYGFLLSLVGEVDRCLHLGARVTCGRLGNDRASTVLRTLWRVKDRKLPPGVGKNARPDFQQLLVHNELVIWLDSSGEGTTSLEERVHQGVIDPCSVNRFGGLSLGESTHLVNDVGIVNPALLARRPETFLLDGSGPLMLPVWVDHVGSAGTHSVAGRLVGIDSPPEPHQIPIIGPA